MASVTVSRDSSSVDSSPGDSSPGDSSPGDSSPGDSNPGDSSPGDSSLGEPGVASAAVERALAEIRPHLHGDIELVGIVGDAVHVRLGGTCTDCSMRSVTLRTGVERILRARVPGIGAVVAV